GLDGMAHPVHHSVAHKRPGHDGHDGQHRQAPNGLPPLTSPAAVRALLVAHRTGARLISGRRDALLGPPVPAEPVDSSPDRVASSALARLRIFAPGTTIRWSANCSPGRSLNGSGLGLRNAGQAASGSSRESSPFLSATLTT